MSLSSGTSIPGGGFYAGVLDVLQRCHVDFLVAGAFALRIHAGIERDTKDFDLMLRPVDVDRALAACRDAKFVADYAYTHWIAKVHHGERFIDLIYRAGNGLCEVDDAWFRNARKADVFGRKVLICPAEEMIWQKAYIMERERFDGADIQHLLRSNAAHLDWRRLLNRFGQDWRVLLSHLILFGFVYPQQRDEVPSWVLTELFSRFATEPTGNDDAKKICHGTLLSRAQYLPDIERWGYVDARTSDRARMTDEEIRIWTSAIETSSKTG